MKQFVWECEECGLKILSSTKPKNRTWSNRHTCEFRRSRKGNETNMPVPSEICPKCRKRTLHKDNELNVLSMDAFTYICQACGEQEIRDEEYKLRQIKD